MDIMDFMTNAKPDPSIFSLFEACTRRFSDLEKAISSAQELNEFTSTEFYNERERFNIWTNSSGASLIGGASLDFRLREATDLRLRVLDRLTRLNVSLAQATKLANDSTKGDQRSLATSSQQTLVGSFDGRPQQYPVNPPPYNQLEYTKREIIRIITSLYRFSSVILERTNIEERFQTANADYWLGYGKAELSDDGHGAGKQGPESSDSGPFHSDGDTNRLYTQRKKAIKPRKTVTKPIASSVTTIDTDVSVTTIESLQTAISKLSVECNDKDIKHVGKKLRDAIRDAAHPSLIPVATEFMTVLQDKSLMEEADEWYRTTLEMTEKQFGELDIRTTKILEQAVTFFMDARSENRALDYCLKLRKAYLQNYGEQDTRTLGALMKSASIYHALSRYEEAELTFTKLIHFQTIMFGENAPATLATKAELVQTYLQRGKFEKADKLDLKVLEAMRSTMGSDHPATIKQLASRALNLRQQERYFEAEEVYLEVVTMGTKAFGESDPLVMIANGDLAMIYYQQDRYKEAEDLLVVVVKSLAATLGENAPQTLENKLRLGITYRQIRRFDQAEPFILAVYKRRRDTLGEDHRDTLEAKEELAGVLLGQGKTEEAEKIEKEILEFFMKEFGPEHAETLCQMGNFAVHYRNAGRIRECEEQLQKVISVSERALGETSPVTTLWSDALARIYRDQGRWVEALVIQETLFRVRRELLDADNETLIDTAMNLALVQWNAGKKKKAITTMGKVVSRMEGIYLEGYPVLISVKKKLEEWIEEVEGVQPR